MENDDFTKRLVKELLKSKWGTKKVLKVLNKMIEEKLESDIKKSIISHYESIQINRDSLLR